MVLYYNETSVIKIVKEKGGCDGLRPFCSHAVSFIIVTTIIIIINRIFIQDNLSVQNVITKFLFLELNEKQNLKNQ